MISAANVTLFDPSSSNPQQPFTQLLNTIKQTLEEQQLCTSGPAIPTNILRVAISSLGSPYWSDDSRALPKFLFALRALLRRSYATCLVTVPGHLLDDIGPLVRCSDSAIQLISFADNTEKYSKNPAFKEFHGLVNIKKLPCINSLVCHLPDTMDWVFKLKRKKLTIEKMHLPPDLSETVSRSQEDPVKAKSCGQTSSGVSIDF
ncbi:ELP4 [Bugula neritina]|uniref:Elongator complex protein 4 n=1 Tax=Bugula neritina TaxID=10212 RepID=A0A7J7IX67_BUGNE|nr:ELP4 [Bugula neritina]